MKPASDVIQLDEFRKRRAAQPTPPPTAPQLPMWSPVWVWVMVWPA